MMNCNISLLHYALSISDKTMTEWKPKDAEASRINGEKIITQEGKPKVGFIAWAKKWFASGNKTHCTENVICTECEVCE
jgi:hypothetical protein